MVGLMTYCLKLSQEQLQSVALLLAERLNGATEPS